MEVVNRYAVASDQIVSDAVDDEVVIVNLETGAYYSLEGTGSDIWRYLTAGHSVDQVASLVQAGYEIDLTTAATNVASIAEGLLHEGLIAPRGDDVAAEPMPQVDDGERRPFKAAELAKFDDMEGLLLLDPVHDVADTGWPNADGGG